jgi:hypothetical protein
MLRRTQKPASNLTQASCLQEKAPAAKKSSKGKSEVPAPAPAKPAKATPKTPAVVTKQVACHARLLVCLLTLLCATLRAATACQLCFSAAISLGCSHQCGVLPSKQLTLLCMTI